jgi:hypothetical protein
LVRWFVGRRIDDEVWPPTEGLDTGPGGRRPQDQQIVLINRDEVDSLIRMREESV